MILEQTEKYYNDLRVQEQQGQEMADDLQKIVNYNMMMEVKQMAEKAADKKVKKKSKVKMTVEGYYTDDNGMWTIYKTESGMTIWKKEKKNVH